MVTDFSETSNPRELAAEAVRACVLATLDRAMPHSLTFDEDEVPEDASAVTIAAIALTALCTVVQLGGFRAEHVQRIFDGIISDERAR